MSQSERTAKTLAEWEELDYFRRPRSLRRLKVVISLLMLAGCVLLCAAFLVPGSKRYLQAGPVSSAHRRFNDRCELCHTEALETAKRLWNPASTTVSDEACLKCHDGPIHSHNQIAADTPRCGSCHQEHRGREVLARVADGQCTHCHANLEAHAQKTPDPKISHVSTFADDHPYGSIWRKAGKPTDPGTIKFNHQTHLNFKTEDLKPDQLPANIRESFDSLRKQKCDYCHQLDSHGDMDREGRYMLTIRYQDHCQKCHPMWRSVQEVGSEKALQAAANMLREQPLPHPGPGQDASVTLGAMRAAYFQFLKDHPNAIGTATGTEGRAPDSRPLPGKAETTEPASREEWDWVNRQMAAVERALTKTGGCYQCHEPPDGQGQSTLKVKPPAIPRRWLPNSVFSHAKHPKLKCLECHNGAATSVTHADVLLPAVASCVECHGRKEGVRNDCLTCHDYHPLGLKRADPRDKSIDEFLQRK